MKKIILFSLFISSLYADAKIYMGGGYGIYDETLTLYSGQESTISANMATLKVGYGIREAYAIEFSVDYVDNTQELFAINDGAKYALNVELIKAFDLGIYVNPFIKVGFGMGYMETAVKEKDDSLSFGTYNLGLGTFIPIGEYVDLELAYNYKYTSYQKSISTEDESETSMVNVGYLGLNFRY
ncbi:MAG: outer membrane beta-barrel protein [Campylobacterota bacterium]|nr:outer membrane beta-barrel protein [Campylobacterota bacterium]